jgi:DNA-binding LacI/PurR family transcriptional regulator
MTNNKTDSQSENSQHNRFAKGPIVKGRPTLAQVAKAAESSVSTVSAVLNNRPDCWASKETRQRIADAARALGYRANLAARTLRGGRTQTIGLITASLKVEVTANKVQAFEEEARRHQYVTMIGFCPNDEALEDRLLESLADRHVDGVAVYPTETGIHKACQNLLAAGLPLVTVDGAQRAQLDCDDISTDYYAAGAMQADYLIKTGKKRIATINTRPNCFTSRQLVKGAAERIQASPGTQCFFWEVDANPDMGSFLDNALYDSLRALLVNNKGKFDAIACPDALAAGCIRAAMELGIKVGKDISIIGFDNSPIATSNAIPITTVGQPTTEIGQKLFYLLKDRIEHQEENRPVQRILVKPPAVIVRASA